MTSRFVCPDCHSRLTLRSNELECQQCARTYPLKGRIPDFASRSHYWNQVTEEQMDVLLDIARTRGYRYAVENILGKFSDPYLVGYVLDASRADFRAVLPITPQSDVLDLGGGWGAVACALAPGCRSVTVLDTSAQNLEFIRIRAEQSGLANLHTARIDPLDDARLPFPDESFDVALLNGVLEYVGAASEGMSPEEVQRLCLREIRRVLRPGAALYVGIENRFGYLYFLGTPDHNRLKYTSLLPRRIADVVTRLVRGEPYRTYTHSYAGYRDLVRAAGFADPAIYLAYPTYREPRFILPGDNEQAIRYFVRRHVAHIRHGLVRRAVQTVFRILPQHLSCRLVRSVFGSYLVVARVPM